MQAWGVCRSRVGSLTQTKNNLLPHSQTASLKEGESLLLPDFLFTVASVCFFLHLQHLSRMLVIDIKVNNLPL